MTGTQINYYFLCHRKLWLFVNNIEQEQTSDVVSMGKFISESTYQREEHEIKIPTSNIPGQVGDNIVLDFYDKKNKIIHEVKKSDKMEDTHIWQVKHYINVLDEKGVKGVIGEIDYPKLKQKLKVELTSFDKEKLKEIENEIEKITSLPSPPPVINKPFCKKCAYYDLCYV